MARPAIQSPMKTSQLFKLKKIGPDVSRKLRQFVGLLLCLFSALCFGQATHHPTHHPRLAPPLENQHSIKQQAYSAETLYLISDTKLQGDGHWEETNYVSVRVNDSDAARDYGRIAIHFNHYYSELELEFANTITSEGDITALSHDALQTRVTGGGQDFYSDSSELVFSLPDISPGSILEFQYKRKSKIIPVDGLYSDRSSPYWFQSTVAQDGWRADFVHTYQNTLTMPSDMALYSTSFMGFSDSIPTTNKDQKTYTWLMNNVSPLRSEPWLPHAEELLPTLYISTMDNWSSIDAWTWRNIEDKFNDPSLNQAIASMALSADASNEEKVRAVYAYLQDNIRYVFAHLGRGGYEPHSPEQVLRVNYGDCKDQSVLAIALLRKLGVQAHPALIETPRSGLSDTDVVALIFDHMIVRIPPDQGVSTQWLDTTAERSLYPGIAFQLQGQNTFIVNGKGGQLIAFPSMGENTATIKIDFHAGKNNTSRADVEFVLSGSIEQNMRSWWIHSTDQENTLNQYLASLFSVYDSLEAEVLDSENLWEPMTIKATFHFSSQTQEEAYTFGASVHQVLRMFTSVGQLPLPDSRQSRFFDDFEQTLEIKVNVHGDQSLVPVLISSVEGHSTPYFNLHYQTEKTEGRFSLNIKFTQPMLNLSASEYQKYYDLIQSLGKEQPWLIKLLNDKSLERTQALANLSEALGDDNPELLIAKALALIEEGKFSEALQPAEQAVKNQSQNGEAWYVLGMAQGYNSLIEQSSESFLKAESLGYAP